LPHLLLLHPELLVYPFSTAQHSVNLTIQKSSGEPKYHGSQGLTAMMKAQCQGV